MCHTLSELIMDAIVNFINDFHDEDATLLRLENLEQPDLESTTALAIDTLSTKLYQEYGHLDNTMMHENSLISTEACETINIIKHISNSDADTQNNTNAETNHGSNTNDQLDTSRTKSRFKSKVSKAESSGSKTMKSLCGICGKAAGKHFSYGYKSCNCCRAFFRRSVLRSTWRKNFVYKCSCVENCQQRKKILCKIDSTTRSYCKFCKYSKCVAAGMMKTQVKNGFSEYRMKDKTNLGNSKPKKIKCSPKEDKNSENDKATPSSCSMDSSTPTKIIDIAQTYSRKSLFISDDLIRNIKTCGRTDEKSPLGSNYFKVEIGLTKEVWFVASEFEEWTKLKHSLKVHLLEENIDALIKLCKLKFICNDIRNELTDISTAALIQAFMTKTVTTSNKLVLNVDPIGVDRKRMLGKAIALLKHDQRVFFFIFPILLFSSNGELGMETNRSANNHYEHFMKLLRKYLMFTSNDNNELVAITTGTIVEIVYHLKHWNEF